MNQLIIRQLSSHLDKKLRLVSKKTGQSLNKTVISLLEKSLGIGTKKSKKRDLSRLAGTWTKNQAEEFEKNTRLFEEIDPELWK